jgi:hypothetical protein
MTARQFRKRALLTGGMFFVITAVTAFSFFLPMFFFPESNSASLAPFSLSECRLPVTVTVYGRSTDTISARIAFYTAEGDLSGTIERSWPGWELKIDCVMIANKSGWIVFPYQVSTDATAAGRGIDLIRYYNNSGLPVIYDSLRLTGDEQKALKRLFFIVRSEQWMPSFLGHLYHQTLIIRSFKTNAEYSLYIDAAGKLSIRGN